MQRASQDHYNTIERYWAAVPPGYGEAGDTSVLRRIVGEIHARLNPDGRRLLDMGCGSGQILKQLARDGYDVWGFDFAQGKVHAAAALNPGRVWKQSFLEPLAHAPFDRIISYCVAQYCRPIDLPLFLHRTIDALAIGGQAVHFCVPIFELFAFANSTYFTAYTETELKSHRQHLIVSAMDGTPVDEDGSFFHSVEKMRELVNGLGHDFIAHEAAVKYALDLEIVRRH